VTSSESRHQQSGFSLIELMVVVSILGIMLTIANGTWTSVREAELVQTTAEKVRSVMTATRIKALSTGLNQYAGIDIYTNAFVSTSDGSSVYDLGADTWSNASQWVGTTNINILDSVADGSAPGTPITTKKTLAFSARGVSSVAGESCVLIKHVRAPAGTGKIIVVNNFTGKVRVDDCTFAGKNCQ
jgi:prepilin-type N-terminal cleavage/methylation domain-containing protein